MQLWEFAVRDAINVERHLGAHRVTVFDDILPTNSLEATRVRSRRGRPANVDRAVNIIRGPVPSLPDGLDASASSVGTM